MAKINRTWEKRSPKHQWTTFWMETLNKAFVQVPKYQKIPKTIGTEGGPRGVIIAPRLLQLTVMSSNTCNVAIFQIFQYGGRCHCGFYNFQIYNGRKVQEGQMNHCAKFHWNRTNCGRDMVIFRLFKMAAAAILDFENFKFLMVGAVKSFEMLQRAKFRHNQSNCCRNMAIFRFFKMAAVAILDF